MKIGKKLENLRLKNNLSLRDAAFKVKMDFSTICRIESGFIRNPKFCDMVKLCDLYKVRLDYLR